MFGKLCLSQWGNNKVLRQGAEESIRSKNEGVARDLSQNKIMCDK
jgi:hypothetical protein